MMFRKTVTIETRGEEDLIDITDHIRSAIKESGVSDGLACVFVPHSTAALITIENEPGLRNDIRKALERIAPKNFSYDHNRAWGDDNGHSHIRSSFLGTSLTIPFSGGSPDLGTWQQVVLVELDIRRRSRKIIIQIIGE
ncbi:MAG: YjbQ family protein [Methanomassiliicoccales archaeon]|nr:YjbQ family protein [Methanomassiliicoccales archaeon]